MDRETPIARILPVEGATPLSIRRPAGARGGLAGVPLPPPLHLEIDIVPLLTRGATLKPSGNARGPDL